MQACKKKERGNAEESHGYRGMWCRLLFRAWVCCEASIQGIYRLRLLLHC